MSITDLFRLDGKVAIVTGASYAPGYPNEQMGRVPSGRMGDPRELAASVVFLASDAAGYVVGQTITVDGGRAIG